MNNYKIEIYEIICKICGYDINSLTEATTLSELSINSLTFVEIIVNIENLLNIEFNDSDLFIGRYITIANLLDTINHKL